MNAAFFARWVPLGGSASQGGVSASPDAASSQPSLAIDGTGAPVVAWTETLASGSRELRVARWDGAAWQSIGGGVSTSAGVQQAKLVNTSAGLAMVWQQRRR